MRETKTILLRNKSDWAFIAVNLTFGVTLMINSSYGSWAFTWSDPGQDPIGFLESADVFYTFGKLSNGMRLSLPNKYIERERRSYDDFYGKFWRSMIEELKK